MWWSRSVRHIGAVTAVVVVATAAVMTTWTKGVRYVDPGAVADDAFEGRVAVTTSGFVDWRRLGYYDVTYSAADSSGNESRAVRRVHVTRGGV